MNLKQRCGVWSLAGLFSASLYGAPLQVTVLDSAGQPITGAVVFLESAAASAAVRAAAPVNIVQRDKTFIPEVTVIPRGTAVTFPNEDTVRHHVYSFSPVKQFEIKLYVGTPANPVVFEQSGVAVLGCNIHDEMIAWVLVLDTPYYAQTDAAGMAEFGAIPVADYTLRVWHKNIHEGDVPQIPIHINHKTAPQRITLEILTPIP